LVVKDLFASIGPVSFPIKVDEVLVPAVAAKMVGTTGKPYKIALKCHNWQATQLSAWLERFPDHADIYFSATENCCWSRFVVCKELAHLLIDTEAKHYTKNPVALVQELINKLPTTKFDHDINSEHVALFAAIEMLLPWQFRAEMEAMFAAGRSDYEIAVQFRAPESIVNLLLKSPYSEISKKANAAT
jgi:Zn-dependent peptidase ImmA (M78 family)